MKKLPKIHTEIKLYLENYDWKYIKSPADAFDCLMSEKNNPDIAWNMLFVPYDKKIIRRAHVSEFNHTRKKQVIILRTTKR